MSEAISKVKRCELCPPDEETCYCYDDKPSVYLTESQLDEIVKEFVKPAVSEDDRRLKMTVLSLVSDLRNCRAEYDEERAAHNAHVTELCRAEEENRKRFVKIAELVSERERLTKENRKLRELLKKDLWNYAKELELSETKKDLRKYFENWHLALDDKQALQQQLQSAQQGIERLSKIARQERGLADYWMRKHHDDVAKLREERDKLIEGLREIDTHIRSTPEPVQYIVETLKRVLPEYQEGVTVE